MVYKISLNEKLQEKISIQLPFSKSISNRALIINALSGGNSMIRNISVCDDTDVMRSVLSSSECKFDIGAAGTAMRFLTAYLSTRDGEWIITGSERMKQRPIGVLVDALRQMGAKIEYEEKEGFPPLHIIGKKLNGGEISLKGDVSSQYISALLMIAPTLNSGLTLRLEGDVISCSYIEMTLAMMNHYGVKSVFDANSIMVPCQPYIPTDYAVEADWSAASYWYEICALANAPCQITLPHLYQNSLQGDSAIAKLFTNLGVETIYDEGKCITIYNSGKNLPNLFSNDFSLQPDVVQTFVVTCCLLGVKFDFTGLKTLRIKETDRIAALVNECRKLGFEIEPHGDDRLTWNGKQCAPSAEPILTYKDHRMAMSFAPAALLSGKVKIDDPMVVTKSYPNFWHDLKNVLTVDEE